MAKFDHHVHTSRHSPDSVIDPLDLLERAREVGLDGVVITEHDYQWEPASSPSWPPRARAGPAGLQRRGGLGPRGALPRLRPARPRRGPAGRRARATCSRSSGRHGAAIVAAHPFRWDQDFEAIVAEHGPAFDALELVSNNVTPETRRKTERLLARHPMGATGSSDGHEPDVVGCYYTEFPGAIATLADFVAALRAPARPARATARAPGRRAGRSTEPDGRGRRPTGGQARVAIRTLGRGRPVRGRWRSAGLRSRRAGRRTRGPRRASAARRGSGRGAARARR